MRPAELAPQYKRVYSDPKKVEALIALTDDGLAGPEQAQMVGVIHMQVTLDGPLRITR